MKKVLSFVLVLALVLAVAVPAFATDVTIDDPAKLATGATTKITGKTTAGEINITVPTTGMVVVNPYGLTIDAATGETAATGTSVQVASAWQAIQNNSTTTDIDVSANVTGLVGGNAKLSAATDLPTYDAAGTIKTNEIWAYLETKVGAALETGALTAPANNVSFAADTNGYQANVLIGSRGTTTKVGKIAKAATGSNSFLSFHINGVANKFTTTPWTAKDTLTVTVIFTFAPAVA